MLSSRVARRRASKGMLTLILVMLLSLLVSGCNGSAKLEQQTSKNKSALDSAIVHAQSIGIPDSMLQPIIRQEDQLSSTSAPIGLLNDQSVNDYYSNLTQRYAMLSIEVNGLISQATQQLDYRASQDLQTLENALAERQAQNFVEARTFAYQLTQYQAQLAKAQYPKDYIQISPHAKTSTQSLPFISPP